MGVTPFDLNAPLGQRRAIIRQDADGFEMVEAAWGLRPAHQSHGPYTVVHAEGRTFPTHRCLVPASEFRLRRQGRIYRFSLQTGDWFYFAGIWRPSRPDWPEAYGILTVEAHADIAPYHDRSMAVLTREQRLDWLDGAIPEGELLRPLPAGSFQVSEARAQAACLI